MWGSHRKCSHIINVFDKAGNGPKHKGNLFLSGVYVLEDSVKENLGINCVLSIIDRWAYQNFQVSKNIQKNGIKNHKWIDLEDEEEEDIFPYFEEAHSYIKENLQEQNVLVHCQMGISRSSSLVIAYLMKEFGLSFSNAFNLVRSKRQVIDPNEGFVEHLKKYEQHLKKNQ